MVIIAIIINFSVIPGERPHLSLPSSLPSYQMMQIPPAFRPQISPLFLASVQISPSLLFRGVAGSKHAFSALSAGL